MVIHGIIFTVSGTLKLFVKAIYQLPLLITNYWYSINMQVEPLDRWSGSVEIA